ncbi:hypothetical protein AAW51_3148 [Caldimonas brevitalea]|uniref:Uncharacterized protein n=1 Tax=Caldimonas brevitalea TaxID=413882 RepID=A0A0G3BK57_9BURK|nr:hypothetical protein AAW51_3148 [Caldimonas brevitalea]
MGLPLAGVRQGASRSPPAQPEPPVRGKAAMPRGRGAHTTFTAALLLKLDARSTHVEGHG